MSIHFDGDVEASTDATAPVWAAFGDLMSVLLGAFVLILVGVIGVQLQLELKLDQEIAQRRLEVQRRQALEQALAAPLAAGRITLVDGRIGIRGGAVRGARIVVGAEARLHRAVILIGQEHQSEPRTLAKKAAVPGLRSGRSRQGPPCTLQRRRDSAAPVPEQQHAAQRVLRTAIDGEASPRIGLERSRGIAAARLERKERPAVARHKSPIWAELGAGAGCCG